MEDNLGNQRHEHSLPRQTNGDDCGVFTILSIYLQSRGVQLLRSSYSQLCVTMRQLRQSIAFALLQANEFAPSSSVRNHLGAPPAIPLAVAITRKRRAEFAAARAKKRMRRECLAALGRSKVTSPTSGQQPQHQPPHNTLINRKEKPSP